MTKRVAVLPVLMCLSACSQLLCTNETVKSLESPDGERRAILPDSRTEGPERSRNPATGRSFANIPAIRSA